MTKQASTFRIESKLQIALKTLSKIARRPMNRLVNEAVELYLKQHGPEVERALEANLASLRAYRLSDPNFERAIEAVVEAEAKLKDPLEGRPVKAKKHPFRHHPKKHPLKHQRRQIPSGP